MQGAHDLGRTPSLVDTQVGDDVGGLEAAIAPASVSAAEGSVSEPHGSASCQRLMICVLRGASAEIVAEKPLPNCAV